MNTLEVINLVCAVIVSPVVYMLAVQLFKRPEWPPLVKSVLAIVVSGIVAIAQSWISGDLGALIDDWGTITATRVVAYWAIVYSAGQVVYNAIGGNELMARIGEWPSRAH